MAFETTSYSDDRLVELYARLQDLFPPERTFLAEEADWLASASMLDIGVGAGRTTRHFAPAVRSYLGIDFSAKMIAVCQRDLSRWDHVRFAQRDARRLDDLADASFDFVMFSFNGIDCVDWEGREQILREIERVTRPGGKFFFSFHNARDLPRLYAFRWRWRPRALLDEVLGWWRMRRINGPQTAYAGRERFRLYDGGDSFRTKGSFIRPETQLARLVAGGWSAFRSYDTRSGEPLPYTTAVAGDRPWVYLVCERAQPGGRGGAAAPGG